MRKPRRIKFSEMHKKGNPSQKILRLSKTVSWLLRHAAVEEGLQINSDGYVRVNQLIEHKSLKNHCTIDDIKYIVAEDRKERFSIRVGQFGNYEIKANQGHSIKQVDQLELEKIKSGCNIANVIHGTYTRHLDSILKNGLQPGTRNHIHFATGVPNDKSNVISGIRSSCEIYIYINLEKALKDGISFYQSPNKVILGPSVLSKDYFIKVIDAKSDSQNIKEQQELFIGSLLTVNDFASEIELLLDYINFYDRTKFVKYEEVCRDLKTVLSKIFPECKVIPFGSTVIGTDLRDSDVDIYVYAPRFISNVQSLENNTDDEEEPSRIYVSNAAKLLRNHWRIFSNIVPIRFAKTPIVKCVHVETQISCDFNFRSALGVQNTSLLKYLLEANPILKVAIVILKFWIKINEFGHSGKFSCYSIILMFIFYLQQSPYNMTTIQTLQSVSNCMMMEEGWNVGFSRNIIFNSSLRQKLDIHRLLLEFFKFYIDFDYALYVICPYLGKIVPKTDFLNLNKLSDDFYQYKINLDAECNQLPVDRPICVEDPFELNCNVCKAVEQSHLRKFIGMCKVAYEIFNDTVTRTYLYKLFREPPNIVNYQTVSKKSNLGYDINLAMGNCIILLNYLTFEVEDNKQPLMQYCWIVVIKRFMTGLLSEVYNLDIYVSEEIKNDDEEGTSNSVSSDLIKFYCNFTPTPLPNKSVVQQYVKNIQIDSEFKNAHSYSELKDEKTDFELTMTFYIDPARVHIYLVQTRKTEKLIHSFFTFAGCVRNNLQAWVDSFINKENKRVTLEQENN